MRFAMIITVITGIVLLVLNIFCAQFSRNLFYRSKQVTMVEKAMLVAEEMGDADVLTAETAAEVVKRLGGADTTRLLVTDTAGRVLYDSAAATPGNQYALYPQIVRALDGHDIFTWRYSRGVIQAETAIPIIGYDSISGCLYMLELDVEQGRFIQTL